MHTVFRYIFILNISATLFLSGSSEAAAGLLTTIFMIVLLIVAAIGLGPAQRGQPIFWLVVCMMFGLALWAWVQHLNWDGMGLHSILPGAANDEAALLLDRESISISPADTIAAIPSVMAPFLAFLIAMMISTSDKQAIGVLRSLGALGGAISILATLKFVFFRHVEIMNTTSIGGGFTAVFVNHNTAATFLGLVVLILSCLCFGDLYLDRRQGARDKPRSIVLALNCTALAFAACALLLTSSRAGIASTVIGLLVLNIVLSVRADYGNSSGRSLFRSVDLRKLIPFAMCLVGVAVMGGRFARAIFEKGFDDPRFCVWPGMLQLLEDNLFFGSGLGTFEVAFPPYRDPGCDIAGTWDKAHNFFLEGFITLGVVFPLSLLMFYSMVYRITMRGMRNRRRRRRYIGLGLAAITLCSVHSMLDFSMQIQGINVFLAGLLGAVVSIAYGRPVHSDVSRVEGQ